MADIIDKIDLTIHNEYLYILLIFIIFDIITGTLKSFSNGTVYSKINKHGITVHITLFIFAIFFSWVFSIFKLHEYTNILLLFYIVSYGLSIIENIGQMGIPLPNWLVNKFKVLGGETNEIERNK